MHQVIQNFVYDEQASPVYQAQDLRRPSLCLMGIEARGFVMDLQKIADEALRLPKEERAQLIQRLLLSLEVSSEEELRSDGLLEARRRAEELVPGDELMRKARALIR